MAILYTQGKWTTKSTDKPGFFEISSDESNQTCELATVRPSDPMMGCNDRSEANAALICDAVNNTAGSGIDPNAVPGLLEALKEAKDLLHTLRVESLYRAHNQRKKQMDKIEQAIKSADLK